MEKVIKLNDVSYRYPHTETESLKRVNLSVTKGKFVIIMGRTGAGKTTLSLTLNGLIPQLMQGEFSGEVVVAGNETRSCRVQTLAKQVGLVLQDAESQIIGRTVEEDVAFGPRNFGMSLEDIRVKVNQTLEKVRLKEYKGRSTAELSGGEKQRLAIAGILAVEPEIMVLDEPTSELDPEGRVEIYRVLDNLRREKNRTLLVIEHSSEEVLHRADEIIVLDHGEIVWKGIPEELFRNIPLLHEFGIKPLPMSLLGWEYYQKGWIRLQDIPLDIVSAETLIRHLRGKIKRIAPLTKPSDLKEFPQVRGDKKISMDSLVIQVRHLVHQYESGQRALQGIEIDIQKGEFVALVGSNGAGKTTLAKHFNGLLTPTLGEVYIKGMNTKEFDTSQLARTIGYVFQNPDHQIFSTSVEKELEYGLKNAGFGPEEIAERIQEALELTGLEKFRHVHPYTLGKGERQLIAVASVLALTPEILVIDEPTTGLDWTGVQKIMGLLGRLHKKGTTILIISHDMDVVAEYAERVIVMGKGHILRDAPTWEALGDFDVLKQAAILPPQICRLSQRLEDWGFPRPTSAKDFRMLLGSALEEGRKDLCL